MLVIEMKRRIMNDLVSWKTKKERKPLIIDGARQVGKTYIIKEFGNQNYKEILYVNFESNKSVIEIFEESIEPDFIIGRLEALFGKKIDTQSLLVFDEIQICEEALTSLKYFYEQKKEVDIIAAGSLLGIKINSKKYSFPVGKVKTLKMFPLDFEEFLWATGNDILENEIAQSYLRDSKINDSLHQKAFELFKTYLVLGGMPEVIKTYIKDTKLLDAIEVQTEILNSYISDMNKYANKNVSINIIACFNSIPVQLAKENKKFQYKVIRSGGSATLFGNSLEWLLSSGIIMKNHLIKEPNSPLEAYKDISNFKIYMNDVGLLVNHSKAYINDILSYNNNIFTGAIVENYVANALVYNQKPLYFWKSKSDAEVDFLLTINGEIIPIEVKAGTNTKSRSLNSYVEKYNPKYSIRISSKNFGMVNKIKSVPLYAVYLIGR